jgi:hypothetical protein
MSKIIYSRDELLALNNKKITITLDIPDDIRILPLTPELLLTIDTKEDDYFLQPTLIGKQDDCYDA